MQIIKIIKTNATLNQSLFFDMHPNVQFPQPLTNEALEPYGAELVESEPAPLQWPRFEGNDKLDLFTPAEQLAVVTATMTDPVVKLVYDRLLGARFWTYEDPETDQGLSLLESKGLITTERKDQIVSAMQPV